MTIPMNRLGAQTGNLFGEGMDRPPMPAIPKTKRFTLEEMREHGLLEEEGVRVKQSRAKARKTDPATSKVAATDINVGGKVNKREEQVLRCLAEHGALNWDGIAMKTGLRPGTVSPRFKPLREKGLIYDTGETAPGVSGSPQILWDLTPQGRAHLGIGGTDDQPTLPGL